MKKIKVEKIDFDQFSKPEEIDDIEVIVGDSSVLEISDVGDYINAVKKGPTEGSTPSIIIPKEKLSNKQKIAPKISKEANSDEIKIPKNVKKAKKHDENSTNNSTDVDKSIKKKKKKKKTQ